MLLDAALRGAGAALLVLLASALLRDRPRLLLSRIGAVFAAGLVVQLVSSTPALEESLPRLWQAPLVAVSVGNAVLFWIFVQALFDDGFALRPWHIGAWLLAAALSGWNCANGWSTASSLGRATVVAQRAVPLVFAVLVAMAAASSWRADLVEKRRRLRLFIVVGGAAYTVASLALRLASPHGRLQGGTALLDVAALTAMVAVVAAGLLRVVQTELFPPAAAGRDATAATAATTTTVAIAAPAGNDGEHELLAESLHRLIHVEHAYRIEGLTVAGLAAQLAVPEYRLRRLINGRLGHRNFNAYVNSFRLDETRAALADPSRRSLPVLTIALEAGFQSIGPFNRAFKAATGMTPTEFRRRHRADS